MIMKILLIILAGFIFLSASPPSYEEVVEVLHTSTLLEKRYEKMYRVYDKLAKWIQANSNINIHVVYPKFEFITQKEINKRSNSALETVAMYHKIKHVIVLNKNFDLRNPSDISALLHEMIHHYQAMNKMNYNCSDLREYAAYKLQKKWIEENTKLDFNKVAIGPLIYLTIQHCNYFGMK